ncbi:MAG: dihydrolipoamide succinyltransferase, partial [Gammaproteobacteria bacterium]
MTIEIKVPVLPESVADATIASWHKQPGDAVERDENLVDIETDKIVLEVVAPADGTLVAILHQEGDTVNAEQVIATFASGAKVSVKTPRETAEDPQSGDATTGDSESLSPAVRRLISEHNLDPAKIPASGKGGRLTREDVQAFLESATPEAPAKAITAAPVVSPDAGERIEKRVPMTRLRARIAERLVESQQQSATLTTFNELNMKPVMDIRNKYKESFEKEKGVRLGFMSFFIKATVEALKKFPAVNASIDGSDIVYHGYYDIGVAVSSPRGLVV